ncbi:MAG: hypothetical protein JOZ42_01460 [Acetobacteraceae bacterium]|nr:hypothetical protein [Acetobacteraceae bacterium]
MDIFEYGKALADFWTLGGKALLSGQENAFRAFSDNVSKMSAGIGDTFTMPNLQAESAEVTAAGQALMKMWGSAAELATTLNAVLPTDTADEAASALVFRKMFDPRAWMSGTGDLDDTLQRMAEGPRFADLWETERKMVRVFRAWLALRQRSLEHMTVVLEAWLKAANNFSEQLTGLKAKGQRKTGKELLTIWVDLANQRLLEIQGSERFLHSQAGLLKASTDLKFAQREIAEYYGGMFGFPTRTELDDVHRTVTELRRELRALRRDLRPTTHHAEKRIAPPEPEPAPEPEPVAAAAPVPARSRKVRS